MPTDPLTSTGATPTKKQPKDTSKVAKAAKPKKSKEGANQKKPDPKVAKKKTGAKKEKRPRDEDSQQKERKSKKAKEKEDTATDAQADANRPAIFKEMDAENIVYVGQYTKMLRTIRQFMDEIAEEANENSNGLVLPVTGENPYKPEDTVESLKLRKPEDLRASKNAINMFRYVLQVLLFREYHKDRIICQLTHKKTLSPEMVHASDLMTYTGNPMLSACIPKNVSEQAGSFVEDWKEIHPAGPNDKEFSQAALTGIQESLSLTGHKIEDADDIEKCLTALQNSMLAIEEA